MRDKIGELSPFSSFKLHLLLASHGSDKGNKGMHSPLLQDYCLLQSTTENKYLPGHSISDDLDMRILNEAMKTYSYQKGFLLNGFRKTMIQTQKFDKMLERQRIKISNVLNLAIDASITEELKFPTPKVLGIAEPEEQESDGQEEIRGNSILLEYSGVGDYVESMIWPFRRSRPSIMHRCKQAITLAVLKITGQLAPKHRASLQ